MSLDTVPARIGPLRARHDDIRRRQNRRCKPEGQQQCARRKEEGGHGSTGAYSVHLDGHDYKLWSASLGSQGRPNASRPCSWRKPLRSALCDGRADADVLEWHAEEDPKSSHLRVRTVSYAQVTIHVQKRCPFSALERQARCYPLRRVEKLQRLHVLCLIKKFHLPKELPHACAY